MRGGWTGGMGRSVVRALLAWGTLVLAPALAAQTEPRLREALRLQADGQSDSARVIVRGVLAATAPTDTLHPQAVFASALVAKDAPEQRRELQRLVVEFPTSAWTAEALVRLAMLDFAGGNLRGAARNVDRLATDFPGAPQLATAALWGARSYFELRNPVLACKWLADGMPKVGEDIELQNQLAFYQQRCTNVRLDAAAVDSARRTQDVVGLVEGDKPPAGAAEAGAPGPAPAVAPGAAPATPAAPAAGVGTFRVQVVAVKTLRDANPYLVRLRKAGHAPFTVTQGGFVKVRLGPYATRADAQQVADRVKAELRYKPFVVNEP